MKTNPTTGSEDLVYTENEREYLSHCTLCPRRCGADRFSESLGFCKSDALFRVSSVCVHKGEECVISGVKGICNIFFPHCNLQCIYCQNWDISRNENGTLPEAIPYSELIRMICSVLDRTENIVGFVSPSHYIPQMLAIIRGIRETGRNPVFVYNTNGFDRVETLRMLEGIIDVYLPDFKYIDGDLSFRYSQAVDYPEIVSAAIKEMYRQKGSTLVTDHRGVAQSGIVVRHLVLPGAADQSIEVLRHIAEEISPLLHISLMSQYYPPRPVRYHEELNRILQYEEYERVTDALYDFGFHRGWTQDLESHAVYRPDFSDKKPFGE